MMDSEHSPASPAHAIERVTDGVPAEVFLLALSGELDISCSQEFRSRAGHAAESGANRLVLDLAEVEFVDSSMLKEFLRVNAEMEEKDMDVVLVAPQPPVRRLLDLTRTTELFTIAPDREEALR